ncbi:hypothetical protein [Hymenobacter actinosclerus]|uniref:Uncharacterized protein n=1 Tax=Hymenobacter actinosclerus TaxID=82805 RepID=A0A1I0C200_9BACT|nr:hypothetical protein [Hymenobacter actinosclerus]SET13382.1 hypothetical protein SAMN04487998_1278 [Hymenobacter actinosclerus]
MIRKLFFFAFLLLLSVGGAWAQLGLGNPKEVAQVKSQPLIVLLRDEDPGILKKLAKKPEELADYKSFVADYNTRIQALTTSMWQFSPGVEFRPESELEALRKAKGKPQGVLQHQDVYLTGPRNHVAGTPTTGLQAQFYHTAEKVSAMVIYLVGNGDKDRVAQMLLAPGPIYTSDLIFSLRNLQQYLDARSKGRSGSDIRAEIAQNGKLLRKKILLIDEEDIKGKLTTADIKQSYPFPYEVVPRSKIEEAVSSGDARYACIRLLPATESIMVQVAMDAKDGTMLAMSKPNTMRIAGIGGGQNIGKNNLKDFADCARAK